MDTHRQLRLGIIALRTSSGKPLMVQLEPGQVVRLEGQVRESGLIEITYEGRSYNVFNTDLLERSDAVSIATGTQERRRASVLVHHQRSPLA